MRKDSVKLKFIMVDLDGNTRELYDVFMGGSLKAINGIIYHPSNPAYELDLEYVDKLLSNEPTAITKEYLTDGKTLSKININAVYDIVAIKQILECKCSTLLGELPYNTNLGVPLNVLPQETELYIVELINNTIGVKSCRVINKQFINRNLSLEIEVTTDYGIITVTA